MAYPYEILAFRAFADGRVFDIADFCAEAIDESKRIYKVRFDVFERKTNHVHIVEVHVYWRLLMPHWDKPPEGKVIFELAKEYLGYEVAWWAWPEPRNSPTLHLLEIGKPAEIPI